MSSINTSKSIDKKKQKEISEELELTINSTSFEVEQVLKGGYFMTHFGFLEKRGNDFFILNNQIGEEKDINEFLITFFDEIFSKGMYIDGFSDLEINGKKVITTLFSGDIGSFKTDINIGIIKPIIHKYANHSVGVNATMVFKRGKMYDIDEIIAFLWRGGNRGDKQVKIGYKIGLIKLCIAFAKGGIKESDVVNKIKSSLSKGKKVSNKILDNKVSKLFSVEDGIIKIIVAEKKLPKDGVNSKINILSEKLIESLRPTDSSEGDRKNMYVYENITFNVSKGEEILRKMPKGNSKSGYDLAGEQLVGDDGIDEIDIESIAGKNIKVINDPDGSIVLISMINGYISGFDKSDKNARLDITPDNSMDKDISMGTGDVILKMDDKYEINGSIQPGRSVIYNGPNLVINGGVSKGKIILDGRPCDLSVVGEITNSEIIHTGLGAIKLGKISFGTIIYAPLCDIEIEEALERVFIVGKNVSIKKAQSISTIYASSINIENINLGRESFLFGGKIEIGTIIGIGGFLKVILEDRGNRGQILSVEDDIKEFENKLFKNNSKIEKYKETISKSAAQKEIDRLFKNTTNNHIKTFDLIEQLEIKENLLKNSQKEQEYLDKIKLTNLYKIFKTLSRLKNSLKGVNSQINILLKENSRVEDDLAKLRHEKILMDTYIQKELSFSLGRTTNNSEVIKELFVYKGKVMLVEDLNLGFYRDIKKATISKRDSYSNSDKVENPLSTALKVISNIIKTLRIPGSKEVISLGKFNTPEVEFNYNE